MPPELKEANVVVSEINMSNNELYFILFLQAYDPLQPLNSINTYEAPDRQSTALDDPSALR